MMFILRNFKVLMQFLLSSVDIYCAFVNSEKGGATA